MYELTGMGSSKGARDVMVTVRLHREAVDEIDRYADGRDLCRSDAVRRLLSVALEADREALETAEARR